MKAVGLKAYLAALVATILFPLVWLRSIRLARRHSGKDSRAVAKVGAAIVAGVAILGAGAFLVLSFQETATAGMYDSAKTRIAVAVGEATYADNQATIQAANSALPVIERNLNNATAAAQEMAANESATAEEREKINKTRDDLAAAFKKTTDQKAGSERNVTALTPNHQLFLRLEPLLLAQDDSGIRSAVSAANLAQPEGSVEGTNAALAIKDESLADMQLSMWLFVWPSLAGAFFAPLAFALGNILRKSFTESDTVGFKPYPGASGGWFLLFGAFGLPSIPFAAWLFMDAENRSQEGQIAL